ncbi:MAG: NmrA family NAD(P)-binding protein [Myxococcota bacterium]
MTKTETTVVLGGNGKTGRRVAERLRALGRPVRAVSRSSETPFDWSDAATWGPALEGADSLYITYYPDLAVPGAADHVRAVTELATRKGTRRLVLLAGRGEPQVHPAEEAVRSAGVDFTILECSFFAQNFSEGVLTPMDGVVAFPGGAVREPFIDCNDIADVAVAALTDPRHAGKTYELTGPEAITFESAVAAMSDVVGPLRYVPVSFEDYAGMLEGQLPPAQIEFFVELFRFLLDGHNAHATDGVEQAIGRPATSFADWAKRALGGAR